MSDFALVNCTDGTCRKDLVTAPQRSGSLRIAASVGENCANRPEDVRVIQDALNQVPPLEGGPSPALKVDGLCWQKTVAAIRRFQREACGFKWPDGQIAPEQRTLQKLREFYLEPNPYAVPLAYAALPEAMAWILAAKQALRGAEWKLRGMPSAPRGLELTNKYFHLDAFTPNRALQAIADMNALFTTMHTCIARSTVMTQPGTGYFQEDAQENRYHAYTWAGGYTMRAPSGGTPKTGPGETPYPGLRKDTIYICPRRFASFNQLFFTVVVVHELAHFCGPPEGATDISDFGYRKQGATFFALRPELALRTADCYAHFAGEARLGREAPYSS
jgi:hypothetical protein